MRNRVPLLSSLLVIVLAGCGGGSSSSPAAKGKGLATLNILWPERTESRLIPTASNAIVVTLSMTGAPTVSKTVSRPPAGTTTTSTAFDSLFYGTYTVDAKAVPNADGTGVAQAFGSSTMAIAEGVPGTANVALGSSITHLGFSPAVPSVAKNATLVVTATALDAANNVVLVAPGAGGESFVWSLDATPSASITVQNSGDKVNVLGLHAGSATLRVSLGTNATGAPLALTIPVTVTAINDGTGTVTVH